MAFDEKFITELKAKNEITEVVGKYCVLKKRGNINHWACCPLPGHSEKTPSFTVNEAGQFFKCFGCGRGGDVITFIMIMENLDYPGAVKYLADRAGLKLPDDERDYKEISKERSRRERMLSLIKTAALYYVHNLRSAKAEVHRKYLAERGVDAKTATAFGLGASTDMFSLVEHLRGKGFKDDEMVDCGVCQRKTNDKGTFVYDALAGRLIIPIINNLDSVIAFGGRLLEKKPEFAKYKNTKETEIFIKNRTLYNINNLKKERAKGNLSEVIMVEGYMDTISVYGGGFKNVVASMGTSLTTEQARILKRYVNTVLISYDGDGAGQKATIRGLEILRNEGLEVKVVRLPEGLDPDDVIKRMGAQAYGEMLKNAVPLIDFKLDNLKKDYDLNDISSRRKYTAEAIKIISGEKSESLREELLRKLSAVTGTTYAALQRDVERTAEEVAKEEEKNGLKEELRRKENLPPEKNDGLSGAEKFILCAALFSKSYAAKVNLDKLSFTDPLRIKIADMVQALRDEGKEIFPAAISKSFTDEELAGYNDVLSCGDRIFGTPIEKKYFSDCVTAVNRYALEKEIKELNAIYAAETDVEKRKDIVSAIAVMTTKLASL